MLLNNPSSQPTLHYTSRDYQAIKGVFGRRGLDLVANAPVRFAIDGRNRVDFDHFQAFIYHTTDGLRDPFVMIHEFAHYFHIIQFRAESLKATDVRCEAFAMLAEQSLAMTLDRGWTQGSARWETFPGASFRIAAAFRRAYNSGWRAQFPASGAAILTGVFG